MGGASTDQRAAGRAGAVEEHGQADGAKALAPLSLRGISKRWPGAEPVLDGVDLELRPGTVLAICGRNGAGKTTLLRIASGLIAPDVGSVRIDGFSPEREGTEFQRRVGLVSAGNSGLYARLTPRHHLELWARLALLPRRRRAQAIERTSDRFELTPLGDKRVDRLSMGQRQRLRLALAFLHDPTVVFLDEPSNSLDDEANALLGAALDAHTAAGGAALVCVPSAWQAIPSVDAAMVLVRGRLEPV